jgi:uncharacterized membrane protein YkvA (DUF1232 family)
MSSRRLRDYEDSYEDEERLPRRRSLRGKRRASLMDDDDRPRPRRGANRAIMRTIRQFPRYLRLLLGLMRDSRVSQIDRLMVIAAAAYIVSPLDFIPDVIPFLGQVDDVFLLMMALQRLVDHAGEDVLQDHWSGSPRELSDLNMSQVLTAASFFLPGQMKRRLKRVLR